MKKTFLFRLLPAIFLTILGIICEKSIGNYSIIIFIIAFIIAGYNIIWYGIKNLVHGGIFDECLLMTVASGGAFALGEYAEACAVVIFYQIGETLAGYAEKKTCDDISALIDLKAETARLENGGEIKPEELQIGDIILIRAGEKIPADCRVIDGNSAVDEKSLTGESLPREVDNKSELLGGSINLTGVLKAEITAVYEKSAAYAILNLLENAEENKIKSEKIIRKFAKIYTPIIFFAAIIVGLVVPFVFKLSFNVWIYRSLTFLLTSCPCALVVSVPLAYFCALGAASRQGILLKGGYVLDGLNDIKTIFFDKTGTLTEGKLKVSEIIVAQNVNYNQLYLLKYVAAAESFSNHPLAKAVVEEYSKLNTEILKVENYEEKTGYGIICRVDGKEVLCGNNKLVKSGDILVNKTYLSISVDGEYIGSITFEDKIKPSAKPTIDYLKNRGIKTVMLTGDKREVAESVSRKIGISEFNAEMLPSDKLKSVSSFKKTLFVGDGLNDAPAMKSSDMGFAVAQNDMLSSEKFSGISAITEISDGIITDGNLSKIASVFKIADKTKKIVFINISLALGFKFAIQILALFGITNLAAAVFADSGIMLLTAVNSAFIFKDKYEI